MPKICYVPKTFKKASLARIEQANQIIAKYAAQGIKLTLRMLYYKFIAVDAFPNTEKSYDNLGALISDARLAGLVDWNAIQDITRSLRSNSHWDSPGQIVEACASQYRIDRWSSQTHRPEVWVEKDAALGVVQRICTELDIPHFSCRGYTSQSGMWEAGQRLRRYIRDGQTPVIFHFGDHDPSGIDMTRDIRERLELFIGGEVDLRRIALTMDQIREYNPPPNPAKVTDSRFRAYAEEFGDESWELDALEPTVIIDLIRESIEGIRDEDEWEQSGNREQHEAGQLQLVASSWDDVVEGLS